MHRRRRTPAASRTLPPVLVLAVLAAQTVLAVGAPAVAEGAKSPGLAPAVTTGTITEFRPAAISQTAQTDPLGITSGPEGNIWFTDAGASRIARIATDGTGLLEVSTNTPNATPVAVTSGPDTANTGANPGDFPHTADSCTGATLTAGATCQVSVAFHPSASGSRTASLVFSETAGTQTVSLTGTGTTSCDGLLGLLDALLRLLLGVGTC